MTTRNDLEERLKRLPAAQRRLLNKLPVQKKQKWLRDSQVLLDNPAIQKLLAQSPQSELEWEIYRRLRNAASPPAQLETEGSLTLPKVAEFLAWLAFCETEQLAWVEMQDSAIWESRLSGRRPADR